MAAAAIQPVVNPGPPMVEVKNIFFKAYPAINYFSNESEADAIQNDVAFQHFTRSLECSSKHGCVFLTFNNEFYLCRVSDMLAHQGGGDARSFGEMKKLQIRNDALPTVPSIIALSTGEDFLAVDTYKGDSAWVVIFKLAEFISQGGTARPFCEIRCSTTSNARIRAISWNPGEGMTNLVAVNADDGALFLAKLLGPSNVELNKFGENCIRCCCWSPKGKQLVVGRINGNLSQLRLDLTEAKAIPGPQPGSVPVSILWTQTTQFLIVFHNSSFIDFMQLDVPKGAAPTYTNSNDIFISEEVPTNFSCFFLPLMPWNVVISMTNSASDVVTLVKQQQNAAEFWIPGDITDNRRAAFLLDNYARGAGIYFGSDSPVSFSEVESYKPMPMIFLLSQRGVISIYSVINSDPQAASLNVKVSSPVPDTIFAAAKPPAPAFTQAPQVKSIPQAQPSLFQGSQQPPLNMSKPIPTPAQQATTQQPLSIPSFGQSQSPSLFSTQPEQASLKPKNLFGAPQTLGTSTLPTMQDMAGLQKAVEEKRREMTTKLEQKASLKGLEDEEHCTFVVTEVRKFEERLETFKRNMDTSRNNLNKVVSSSFDLLEKRVLTSLNIVEDFTSDMVSTTSAQKEEVDMLKERILSHFSQLEYAKSLVERSRDPRYIEHLRSRPLDPASQQKFEDLQKLHNYLRNQVAECRRHFYEQTRKSELPIDRVSHPQLIYITLSNHSKIIRRLRTELDTMKERLGLGRQFEDSDYLAVCEASYAPGKKDDHSQEFRNDPDEITLRDLTTGISKVKLNAETGRPDKKPVKLSNRKLFILKNSLPEVKVIKVKAEETTWVRSPSKTATRPKPMAQPTSSIDQSTPMYSDSSFDSRKPFESAPAPSTFIAKKEQSQPSIVPKPAPAPTGLPTAFSSISTPAFGLDLSGGTKPTISSTSTGQNPVNLTKMVSSVPQGSSLLKASLQAPSSGATTSPSAQLPTLAGLLATPVPASSSSLLSNSLFSSATTTGASKPFGASIGTSKDDKAPAFGTGSFSFASAATKSTPNQTQASTGLSTSASSFSFTSSGVAPNASVINFGTSQGKPVTTSAGSGIVGSVTPSQQVSKSESTSITGTSNVFSASVPSFTSSIGSSGTLGSKVPSSTGSFAGASGTSLFSTNTPPTAGIFGGSGDFKVPTKAVAEPLPLTKEVTITPLATKTMESKPTADESAKVSKPSVAVTTQQPSITPLATPSSTSLFSGAPTISFGSPGGIAGLFGSASATTPSASAIKTEVASESPSQKPAVATITPVPNPASVAGSNNLFAPIVTSTPGTVSTTTTAATPSTTSTSAGNLFSPVATSTGLFSSTLTPSANTGLFTSPSTTTSTPTASGGAFALSAGTTPPSGLFTASTTTSTSVFGASSTTTSSAGTFGACPATTVAAPTFQSPTVTSPPTGLFSSTTPSTPATGLFSNTATVSSAPTGLFSSVATTTNSSSGGMFGSSGFFSPTTTAQGTGFMSSLSISSPTDKPATTTSAPPTGLFSSPFGGSGNATTSAANIFGGGSVFGGQSTTAGATGNTGSTTQSGFGGFGTKPATGAFGAPAGAGTSVFGGSPAFGGSSAFGSGFGSSGSPAFGSSGTSVFGSSAPSTTQPTGFGTLAQQGVTPASPFGGSPFGGASAQQGSVFGSPQPKPTGGLFSTSFGTPTSTSSSGVFGQSASVFGSPAGSGTFTAGATQGGVAQQGFGFGQAKPAGGTAFGSPPSFGGGATFGQSSPFGSSFSATPTSTFGSGGGSVFGGGGTAPATGFGNLAQQGATSPGFGGGFAAAPQSPQQPSLFGSPQQAKPSTFGGNAFSSWR